MNSIIYYKNITTKFIYSLITIIINGKYIEKLVGTINYS